MLLNGVLQRWKSLWAANAFGAEEISAGIVLIGSPLGRRSASACEVHITILVADTDDTEINIYSAPVDENGDVGAQDGVAKDSFVIDSSEGAGPHLLTIMVDPAVVGSGFKIGVKALGATENMTITADYQLYRR